MNDSTLPKILVVDDEVENVRALERTLKTKFDVTGVTTPTEALKLAEATEYAVIICDQKMPEMRGTELLAQVAQKRPLTTRVILTGFTETKEILEAINRVGIYRYLTKPWDNAEFNLTIQQAADHYRLQKLNIELVNALRKKEQELTEFNKQLEQMVEKRTAELKVANEKLSELAMTDPLTKIMNRRGFSLRFNQEIERAMRYKHPLTLAMIDVDQFKFFNDTEGHVFGDEALKKIAQCFHSNLRKSDVVARYGGEELVILMPETRSQQGREICERLRMQIENTKFQGKSGEAYLTVSIGIASFPEHGKDPEALVKAADNALYMAKDVGRNRVMLASNQTTLW